MSFSQKTSGCSFRKQLGSQSVSALRLVIALQNHIGRDRDSSFIHGPPEAFFPLLGTEQPIWARDTDNMAASQFNQMTGGQIPAFFVVQPDRAEGQGGRLAIHLDDREGNPFEYRWVAIIGGGDQQCGDSGGDELPDLFCIPLSGFAVGGQHELSAVVADAVIDALHNVGKKAVGDFRQNQAQRDWFLKRAPGAA